MQLTPKVAVVLLVAGEEAMPTEVMLKLMQDVGLKATNAARLE